MNFKRKHENVYQTKNFKSQIYSHDCYLKMIGEAYLFFLSTEFRVNQTKIRLPQLAPTWTLYQTNLKKQKCSFIKRVDEGWITTVKGLESWRFER